MLSWMKLEEKSDLAVQNQDYREEKLWSKRFGFFFSKPNHSSCENLLEGWAVSLSRRQQGSSEVWSFSSSSSLTPEMANKSFVLRKDASFLLSTVLWSRKFSDHESGGVPSTTEDWMRACSRKAGECICSARMSCGSRTVIWLWKEKAKSFRS